MICRRRLSRHPVAIAALIFIAVLFLTFIKLGHVYSVPNTGPDVSLLPEQHVFESRTSKLKLNKEDSREIERLKGFQDMSETKMEDEILLRKYNESLKQQEEENDPFKESQNNDYVDFSNFATNFKETVYTASDLRSVINNLNKRRLIYNKKRYPHLSDNHPVLVIQVHKRIEYLRELLDSLQKTRGIENVLLVISHDFYSDAMNALIRLIHFCKVIQIYFPYSLQLYPNVYPGQSKGDCPRDMKKDEALQKNCLNAAHPDKYGHYREAHITMTKHHWWWKINHVFDEILRSSSHSGPVIFMEEDHYVAPSFFEALMALHDLKHSDPRCKDSCHILTMGSYNNKENYQFEGTKVNLGNWISSQHNMGMAMYKNTWEDLKKCADRFCAYDDYNWDWTLMHLSKTCFPKPLTVLVYEIPRMFHVGDCGLHHKELCTNRKATLNKVKGMIERNKDFIFTDKINLIQSFGSVSSFRPNGGWGDERDHELCRSFVKPDSNLMRR